MRTVLKTLCSSFIFVAVIASVVSLFSSVPVSAAACVPNGTLGQISSSVSVVNTGSYVIWTRMKIPDSANQYYQLEVNGNTCYMIGSTSMSPGSWNWINFQNSNPSSVTTYSFAAPGNFPLKLYGFSKGVEIDRVIFLKSGEKCGDGGFTPIGTGGNCANTSSGTPGIPPSTPSKPTTSNGNSTGGTTSPSSPASVVGNSKSTGSTTEFSPSIVENAKKNPDDVSAVQYDVDGKNVQQTSHPEALETCRIDNGNHIIKTTVKYKSGEIATQSNNVTVNNETGLFHSIRCWLKVHKRAIVVATSIISVIAAVGIGVSLFALSRRRKHIQPAPAEYQTPSAIIASKPIPSWKSRFSTLSKLPILKLIIIPPRHATAFEKSLWFGMMVSALMVLISIICLISLLSV